MTTPESYTAAFKDGEGKEIYHLGASENTIYSYVQSAIDAALAEGADVVVGIGHMDMDTKSAPWRSTDIIENTHGLDIFIDGHSHDVVFSEIYQDSQGNEVILTQTGSHFTHIGEITIDLNTLDITVDFVAEDFALTSEKVDLVLTEIQGEFADLLQEEVAECEVDLLFTAPGFEDDDDMVRLQETNLGNLVTDAYRVVLEADIAFINGGGIRGNLEKGIITYEDIINIHPFGNELSSMKVSGLAGCFGIWCAIFARGLQWTSASFWHELFCEFGH